MTDNESFLASLGVTVAAPPLPDQVWEQILAVALDPTTATIDADLVPEQDDVPVALDDVESSDIVLHDDDLTTAGIDDAAGTAHHNPAALGDDTDRHSVVDQPLLIDDPESAGSTDRVDEHGDYPDLGHLDVGDDSY